MARPHRPTAELRAAVALTFIGPAAKQEDQPWPRVSSSGAPLKGQWKFVVTDLWPIDNGFLFDWTIKFNPNSVADCSGPIISRQL